MTKSLILAVLVFGAAEGFTAEPIASEPSASDQMQAVSESPLVALERQIVLKQKERTKGTITPESYREWEAKFRTTFVEASAAFPQSPETAAVVARIESLLGDGKQADASLGRALEANPENPTLLRTKGQLFYERKDFSGAAEHALLAWEKSGHTDKSAWALYQQSKGRVAPRAASSQSPPTAQNPGPTAAARDGSNYPSGLYTGEGKKREAVIVPNVGGATEQGTPVGETNKVGLVTLLGAAAGVFLIAWGALPKTTKDSFVDPIALWRKTNRADHRAKAVTSDQFLEHYRGRSLNDAMHDKDVDKTGPSVTAGGPVEDFRYVSLPNNPDIVLDMRHFLVVGRMGETAGLGIEVVQAIGKQDSAFQAQDFVSNHYGANFFAKYDPSRPFDEQLAEFFEHPEKFDAPGWKVK